MIEAHGLTKDYGEKRAVDELSFTARSGIVTDFLGPNGSGKRPFPLRDRGCNDAVVFAEVAAAARTGADSEAVDRFCVGWG